MDAAGATSDVAARSLHFVGPRTVDVRAHPVPEPAEGEVLVESRTSLVSAGTELMIYRGEAPDGLPADETIDALAGDLSFPLQYGYALVGEVEAVGGDVPPGWTGRRVFVFNPHESHVVADADALMPVPDDVGTERAAFVPIAETAVNLVLDGAPRIGERVVVFGAGLVGLFAVAALGQFPLDDLTVVEPVESRRALALELGADVAIPPGELDEADLGDADLVFELSGSPAALDDAVGVAGYDARVVVGSWYGAKRADLDLGGRFHRERIELVSSQVSTIDPSLRGRWDTERRMALAWDQLRDVPVDEFVTHRVPIADAGRAYELLDSDPESALGVLLTYE